MRVFISCPANTVTGGPELLHQFSAVLTALGVENYMWYYGEYSANGPTPERYAKYGVKYVSTYVDAPDSVLVLPEVRIHYADFCKKGKAMIWWLSVDNYITAYRNVMKEGQIDVFDLKNRPNVVHFVQSFYAKQFLTHAMGIAESYFLTDYINDDILAIGREKRTAYERQNICLYNPKKGYENLAPIIEQCREDIEWIPLKGFTPAQMADMMCKAKVYIDFGAHPGKDRIPREAATCGCLVMTNTLGSALFAQDVPIPQEYKIQDMTDVNGVLESLYDLVDHYHEKVGEYEMYRLKIAGEKEGFAKEAKEAVKVLQGKVVSDYGMREALTESEQDVFSSLESAVAALQRLVTNAKSEVATGKPFDAIGELLTADYVLAACKQAVIVQAHTIARHADSGEES